MVQPAKNSVYRTSCRRRGGCLEILGVMFLVILLVVGITVFFTVRWVHKQVETYTATSPVALPRSNMDDADYANVEERITQFTKALNQGQPTAPLVLNEQELNAFIERTHPNDLGKEVYVVLDGNQVKGEVSFPLDNFKMSWLKGRYLNGNVTLDVSLQNRLLVVTAQQIEVNGVQVPDSYMQGFRTKNLAEKATEDPKNAATIAKFDSIQVQDGKLIIKAEAQPAP